MHASHPLAQREELRIRDCAEYPLGLPTADIGGRQLLERFAARSSVKLRSMVENNSFEFMRGYLRYEQAISFQIAIGAVTNGEELVAREIVDRGFPRGQLVLASLRGRQLPVVAYASAEHLMAALSLERAATPKAA